MVNEKRRIRLLHMVMRLREIEHQAAAAAASSALGDAARTRQLAARAAALVAGYADFSEVNDAHDLAVRRFAAGRMRLIADQTDAEANHAASLAEQGVNAERKARRKREATEEARARLLAAAAHISSPAASESKGLARFLKDVPDSQQGF